MFVLLQALRPGVQNSQDGSFRATFEDKPLMSDIIFLRAWIGVDLPKFYNPVTNLLAPAVKPAARQTKPGHMPSEVSHMLSLMSGYRSYAYWCGLFTTCGILNVHFSLMSYVVMFLPDDSLRRPWLLCLDYTPR